MQKVSQVDSKIYNVQKTKYSRMPLFKDVVDTVDSIFKNAQVLDFDHHPKLVKHRESQQFAVAACIKPLFSNRNGENVLVYGTSGIGKTLACINVLNELEEETDKIVPIFVNCWQHNTTYKVALNICEQLNYPFTQNKKGTEIFKEIADLLKNKSAVFVFDEIDKAEELDFLYVITENFFKNTIVLITNHKEKLFTMDKRVRSRLSLELVKFPLYGLEEIDDIMRERIQHAFYPKTWSDEAINFAASETYNLGDMRCGLLMLQKAGRLADTQGADQVEKEHITKVLDKIDKHQVKGSSELDGNTRDILDIIKEHRGLSTVNTFKKYQEKGGKLCYRSFHRKIKHLEMNKYIFVERVYGGKNGNSSIIKYLGL